AWLAKFERLAGKGAYRIASDINWRRLKFWRRILGQALDPASAPGGLESISEVLVEHGPHAVVQSIELVSWLAARLDWEVEEGHVEPGVEMSWRFQAPHGRVRVRIDRWEEGPTQIHCVRINCRLSGKPAVLNFFMADDRHLAVLPEGIDAAPRTVTIQP